MSIFTKKTDADKELEKLTQELRASRKAFETKTGKIIRKIENDIEVGKHLQNVTDKAIAGDMAEGIANVAKAAEGIVFPEDVA